MSAEVSVSFIKKEVTKRKRKENCKATVKVLLGFKALLAFLLPLKSNQITEKT